MPKFLILFMAICFINSDNQNALARNKFMEINAEHNIKVNAEKFSGKISELLITPKEAKTTEALEKTDSVKTNNKNIHFSVDPFKQFIKKKLHLNDYLGGTNNSEGIKGVGEKIGNNLLAGVASDGNGFRKYSDAEYVAKNITVNTAIVAKNNLYYLYSVDKGNTLKLEKGDSSFLDKRVIGIVKNGNTIHNHGSQGLTSIPNDKISFVKGNKIILKDQEYKVSGINVYDLADVGKKSQEELEKTLKLISYSGANTIRCMAFSRLKPEDFIRVLDTNKKLGLNLKFILVLGNHWQDMEKPGSNFIKNDEWYKEGYKKDYLPHVKETAKALLNRDEILMIELLNEPEAQHQTLKNFADEVSTTIRQIYTDYDKEHNTQIPRHLISLGTLGGEHRPGMVKDDYRDLFELPNIDVVTAHDYTYDANESSLTTISPLFQKYINYANELNKPFFLGEIGIKVRKGGTEHKPEGENIRDPQQAMEIMGSRLQVYKEQGISGALVWGPEPNGHAVDGAGLGFTFKPGDNLEKSMHDVFNVFNPKKENNNPM